MSQKDRNQTRESVSLTDKLKLRIEKTKQNDLSRLCEIEKESFNEEAFTYSHLAALLTDINAIALTASLNGETVGFVIALAESAYGKSFGHIITIDVAPPHQRKGIGQKLLKVLEMRLLRGGLRECHLEVRENNLAALSLYEKNGYKIARRLERYYGNSHGLYLKKALTADRDS